MPTFRLQTRDGHHDTITANRPDITDDRIVFLHRRDAGWRAVASAELTEVRAVAHRLTEVDGRRRYVPDRDVAAALRSSGSEQ